MTAVLAWTGLGLLTAFSAWVMTGDLRDALALRWRRRRQRLRGY